MYGGSALINFNAVVTDRLMVDDLDALFDQRTGILRLTGFLTPQQRKQALEGLTEDLFHSYNPLDELGGVDPERKKQLAADLLAGSSESSPPTSRRVGITIYEFVAKGSADEYFQQTSAAESLRRRAFAGCGDLIDHVLAVIRGASRYPVDVAVEPGRGRYYAGVVREVHGLSRIHTDDSQEETPDHTVANVVSQLGLYVYLDMPASGGALVVYGRQSRADDGQHRRGYGLDPRAVSGDPFVGVTPAAGDLILFQAKNLHRVEACSGPGRRILLVAFLGQTNEGSIVCWS